MIIQTPPPAVPEILTVSAILFVPQQGESDALNDQILLMYIFLQNDHK